MRLAGLFDPGLDLTQLRCLALDPVYRLFDFPAMTFRLVASVVALLQPQQVLPAPELSVQFAVLARDFGLGVQTANLPFQFVADVVDAGQILAGIFQAILGFPPPVLVLGNAGGFFQEETQVLRLGFDNARDHSLADDGIGPRAQASTEEEVNDVAPAHVQVVDVVIRVAIPVEHALDGDLGVLRPLPRDAALSVVEEQFNAGAADFLAPARAFEDDVLDGFAAKF